MTQPLSAPAERIWLLSPVYFDAESYRRLRQELTAALDATPSLARLERHFVIVDDSGGADPDTTNLEQEQVRVLRVPFPLGHQRALVFALRQLAPVVADSDVVVTLDADGEDKPEDLPRLLAPLLAQAQLRRIAIAERTRRRESAAFKVLYFFFKLLFVLLTGGIIRSGNYCAYRGWMARNLLFHPHFDLCYSSSLLTFGLQMDRVPCERGKRYAGQSKMTWLKLVMHGIRMLMPYADRIAIRGLVAFSILFALGVAMGVAVVAVRLFTDLAIPGWATYTLLLSMLMSGTALGCLILVFTLFVQSQSLSMSRLDSSRGDLLGPEPRITSPRAE